MLSAQKIKLEEAVLKSPNLNYIHLILDILRRDSKASRVLCLFENIWQFRSSLPNTADIFGIKCSYILKSRYILICYALWGAYLLVSIYFYEHRVGRYMPIYSFTG